MKTPKTIIHGPAHPTPGCSRRILPMPTNWFQNSGRATVSNGKHRTLKDLSKKLDQCKDPNQSATLLAKYRPTLESICRLKQFPASLFNLEQKSSFSDSPDRVGTNNMKSVYVVLRRCDDQVKLPDSLGATPTQSEGGEKPRISSCTPDLPVTPTTPKSSRNIPLRQRRLFKSPVALTPKKGSTASVRDRCSLNTTPIALPTKLILKELFVVVHRCDDQIRSLISSRAGTSLPLVPFTTSRHSILQKSMAEDTPEMTVLKKSTAKDTPKAIVLKKSTAKDIPKVTVLQKSVAKDTPEIKIAACTTIPTETPIEKAVKSLFKFYQNNQNVHVHISRTSAQACKSPPYNPYLLFCIVRCKCGCCTKKRLQVQHSSVKNLYSKSGLPIVQLRTCDNCLKPGAMRGKRTVGSTSTSSDTTLKQNKSSSSGMQKQLVIGSKMPVVKLCRYDVQVPNSPNIKKNCIAKSSENIKYQLPAMISPIPVVNLDRCDDMLVSKSCYSGTLIGDRRASRRSIRIGK